MMNTKNNHTKSAESARAVTYVSGMKKRYPNGSTVLTLGGGAVTLTVDQTVTKLETVVGNRAAVVDARAQLKAKVAAEDSQLPALIVFMDELEAYLRVQFGADPGAVADFALAPKKAHTPRTAEQKAISAAKAKATRQARKAAKVAKGNVTATLVVTPQGATAAAAATAPATAPTPVTAPTVVAVPAKA